MKVLITGASGFIGKFLVAETLNRGYETWAGVRASSSREGLQDPRIRFIDLSYGDKNALALQLKEFGESEGPWDYVIHNAGITKSLRRSDFMLVNAEYAGNFAEALSLAGFNLKRFVLMSTLGAYGPGNPLALEPLKTTDPQRPDSLYGKSKQAAEKLVVRQTHFPHTIFYPTGVYGPGDLDYFEEIRSVSLGLDLMAGLRVQHISFIYVKDLARAIFMAMTTEASAGKRYFISDGHSYSDAEFSGIIADILKKKRLLRIRIPLPIVRLACLISEQAGKIKGRAMTLNLDKYKILRGRNWTCDSTPLHNDTGFVPKYNLRQGLEESIAWYKSEGWL
jgi:nucleoside-diphosphate-sugar epimerase